MLKFTFQPLSYDVVFDQAITQTLLALLGIGRRYLMAMKHFLNYLLFYEPD